MKTEIIVALIGASAVIVGAIIAALATIISTHKKSREDGRPESNTVTGDNNITLVGNKNNISINEQPKKSILSFATSKVDPEYILNVTGTEKKVYDEGFAMINVRILNKGNLDAAVTKLVVSVKDYIINTEPHFCFFMYVKEGDLFVDVLNNGWGAAENFIFNISLFDNNDGNKFPITYIVYHQYFSKSVKNIYSNERVNLFRIKSSYFDANILKTNVYKKEKNMRNTPFNNMLIEQCAIDISAVIAYEKHGHKTNNTPVRFEYDRFGFVPNILLSSDSFSLFESPVCYSLGKPDTIYATIVDERTLTKEYNISRIINSGGIDDFNIYVGSDKSCNFNITLSFYYNDEAIITSDEIPISITRYTNSKACNYYIDGCQIALENFRKKNQLQDIFW